MLETFTFVICLVTFICLLCLTYLVAKITKEIAHVSEASQETVSSFGRQVGNLYQAFEGMDIGGADSLLSDLGGTDKSDDCEG